MNKDKLEEKQKDKNKRTIIIFGMCNAKEEKWLLKIKTNRTLYFDVWVDGWVEDRPKEEEYAIIPKNTTLYVYKDNESIDGCKYVGKLINKSVKIGWEELTDVIENKSFDIIAFTEKCRKEYLEELEKEDE